MESSFRSASRVIVLREHKPDRAALTEDDVALLRGEFRRRVDIALTEIAGLYELQPHQHVGFVVLPSQRVIEIRPKVRIDVLFAMLSKVHDLARFMPEPQTYTSISELFEFVVNFFVGLVEDLVAQGILRDFVPVEEELIALRGKVMVGETIRRRPVVRDRHWCQFVDFTANVPENQILKIACQVLFPFPYRRIPDLSSRLHRLLRIFFDVDAERDAEQLYNRLVYHRLNEHYRPALSLAKLLLTYLSPSGSRGEHPFQAFLVDMNKLFEQYVFISLQEHLAGQRGLNVFSQVSRWLDFSHAVTVQPDVVFYRDETPLLILDTKYKRSQDNTDVYQVIAYCHAFHTSKAVLVYPLSEIDSAIRYRVQPDAHLEVVILSLDLSGGIDALQKQTSEFAQETWREVDSTASFG